MKYFCTQKSDGFSVLEALVAMFILASVGTLTMQLFQSQIDSLTRLQQKDDIHLVSLSARELIEYHISKGRREGQLTIGDFAVDWQADANGSSVRSKTTEGRVGAFNITLFEVSMSVSHARLGFAQRLNTKIVGFEKIQ